MKTSPQFPTWLVGLLACLIVAAPAGAADTRARMSGIGVPSSDNPSATASTLPSPSTNASSSPPPASVAVTPALAAQVKAHIESNTAGAVVVDGVATSPIAGLVEVTSGMDVFYADPTGRYALVEGRLMDLQGKQDLTAAKLERLSHIDFQKLPFELAIKTVHGRGRRHLAVFEDPTCPVCRALHKFLAQLPDVTLYTFVYPVVSPEAGPIARDVWCSPNRTALWDDVMNGAAPPVSTALGTSASCNTEAIDKTLVLGDQLHVFGTPTVFLSDGRRMVGATPPDEFLKALDGASKAVAFAK